MPMMQQPGRPGGPEARISQLTQQNIAADRKYLRRTLGFTNGILAVAGIELPLALHMDTPHIALTEGIIGLIALGSSMALRSESRRVARQQAESQVYGTQTSTGSSGFGEALVKGVVMGGINIGAIALSNHVLQSNNYDTQGVLEVLGIGAGAVTINTAILLAR